MEKRNGNKAPKLTWLESLAYVFGPWHPALIHFPIACSILAAAAFWMGNTYGMEWSSKAAGVLWIAAFAGGLASLLTGHFFAHRLGRYSQWTLLPPTSTGPLHFHALLGTIGLSFSLLTLPGAFHILRGQHLHGYSLFFFGIAEAVFFAWCAHEGGEITFKIEMVPLTAPHARKGFRQETKGKRPLFRFRIF